MSDKTESLNVCEVFYSIQGEGLHTGRYVTFVRLWGCNAIGKGLECVQWCDTHYAWDMPPKLGWRAPLYSPVSATDMFDKFARKLLPVVFTGGEPMLQLRNVWGLVEELALHIPVAIETNGTIEIPSGNSVWITCSPKPPQYKIVPKRVDEVKIVVSEKMCGVAYLKELTKDIEHKAAADYYYLQPEDNNIGIAKEIANMLCYLPGWRLGTQLHKTLDVQ